MIEWKQAAPPAAVTATVVLADLLIATALGASIPVHALVGVFRCAPVVATVLAALVVGCLARKHKGK